jgi:hypothetical protein
MIHLLTFNHIFHYFYKSTRSSSNKKFQSLHIQSKNHNCSSCIVPQEHGNWSEH